MVKCEHGRQNHGYSCIQCWKNRTGGRGICPCGKQKATCKQHGGASLCACGKQRQACTKCNPCPHGKLEQACKKCNPKYFTHTIRSLVYNAFRRSGNVKDANTLSFLGVSSFDQLKYHFEVKINIWNYKYPDKQICIKTMAIDHIKPIAKFDDSEEAKKQMNHFTNLQPLPPDVNKSKSAKWNEADEAFWRAYIIGNAFFYDIYLP